MIELPNTFDKIEKERGLNRFKEGIAYANTSIKGGDPMSRVRKNLIGLAVFFFLFTFFGFFFFPPVLKSILTKKVSENLCREVSVQQIEFNRSTISLTINGFFIKERPSRDLFFSVNKIKIANGSIGFDDRPKRIKHVVRDLNNGCAPKTLSPKKKEKPKDNRVDFRLNLSEVV